MIRTLIVDNEKLVRRGIIATVPWDKYGMQVVGEAYNGQHALEFIKKGEVDLVSTDLIMPIMSGFQLMEEINKKYAHVYVVVLTAHKNFDYAQESIRLGAVDYIVKSQFDIETCDRTFKRIASKINKSRVKSLIC